MSRTYKLMRKAAVKILERVNPGDIHIRHHYTKDKIKLHSFRHKGYWFHGKNRERATIDRFSEIISAGDTVIEVGGLIVAKQREIDQPKGITISRKSA